MFRSESWPGWGIGLLSGAAAGFLVLLGGAPLLAVSVLLLALAFVAARSLAFVSGVAMGLGGLWCALVVRQQLACDAFDAARRNRWLRPHARRHHRRLATRLPAGHR